MEVLKTALGLSERRSIGEVTQVKKVRTVLRVTVTGIVVGLLIGWLASLPSGNPFVVLLGGSVGTLVGVVTGFIHRNDP